MFDCCEMCTADDCDGLEEEDEEEEMEEDDCGNEAGADWLAGDALAWPDWDATDDEADGLTMLGTTCEAWATSCGWCCCCCWTDCCCCCWGTSCWEAA